MTSRCNVMSKVMDEEFGILTTLLQGKSTIVPFILQFGPLLGEGKLDTFVIEIQYVHDKYLESLLSNGSGSDFERYRSEIANEMYAIALGYCRKNNLSALKHSNLWLKFQVIVGRNT